MKNAILFHGTGCNPNSFWFPKTKTILEKMGYEVWVPALPDCDTPDIEKWLPEALKGTYTNETILIGHSAGSPLVLSVLEHIDVQIHKAVLVAGYLNDPNSKILQKEYNWEKIKHNAKDMIIINSENDPWGCDDEQGLILWKHLGGTLILREGEGHMGSDRYKQPYTSFPLLEMLLEVEYTRSSINGLDKK